LTQAILNGCDPASVTGVDPSAGFVEHCSSTIVDPRATFVQGDAVRLPDDVTADVVVAGLVLNFLSDPATALAAMRDAAPGGCVAAYVWDYAGGMEMLRFFWETAVALRPEAHDASEAMRFPICDPHALERLWIGAGLSDVLTRPVDVPTVFADFDDYWAPFLLGQGPAPVYVDGLDDVDRDRLAEALEHTLPTESEGSITMTARAWAVKGSS